ncbi:MAG: methyltransferase domain-containing protein [Acidobacteria bacterium]|nr:methyltransferase domain-containing protein [Acidobacteriota bacterium]
MTPEFGPDEVESFRSIVGRRLGLDFEDTKLGFLADVLSRRVRSSDRGCGIYLRRLESGPAKDEIAALAQELTVAETYFFRNIDQFRALAEVGLPDRMRAQAARRRLRLLSAGCASGEEAYSLAILVRENVPDAAWDVSILGIDVNPAMLERAARARFSAWALRETPSEVKQRWFRSDGRDLVLDDAARTSVKFEERNLNENEVELWEPGAYDVVFCRNVIMYFTPESAQALIGRIARTLAPGGYLFLGHAETLRGLSQDFHLRHTHGTFYYQRRSRLHAPHQEPSPGRSQYAPPAPASLTAVVEGSDTWVEAIRRASERIQAITRTPSQPLSPRTGLAAPRPRSDLGQVLDLFHRERFRDALELVRALPPDSAKDPDVLLVHAVLLTHSGRISEAEETCRKLLEMDELNAGAHYLLALCREGAGDRSGAIDHDQVAVYLDPGFAMPRLHLGLLARKASDRQTERRELSQALLLLQREDASRLLLFGGGFGREALIALCQAEIVAAGGNP